MEVWISRCFRDGLVLDGHSMSRPVARLLKRQTFKKLWTQYTMRVYCDKDCPQKENVKQMFANSTVLILQKWQTPIFGVVTLVVQNFQNTPLATGLHGCGSPTRKGTAALGVVPCSTRFRKFTVRSVCWHRYHLCWSMFCCRHGFPYCRWLTFTFKSMYWSIPHIDQRVDNSFSTPFSSSTENYSFCRNKIASNKWRKQRKFFVSCRNFTT